MSELEAVAAELARDLVRALISNEGDVRPDLNWRFARLARARAEHLQREEASWQLDRRRIAQLLGMPDDTASHIIADRVGRAAAAERERPTWRQAYETLTPELDALLAAARSLLQKLVDREDAHAEVTDLQDVIRRIDARAQT